MQQHNMADYEETVRTFKLDVPERFNFAREVIGRYAEDPEHLAMWWLSGDGSQERKITFKEFAERSDKFAEILQKSGVKPGDRVLVQLPRIPAWWEVLLGCMKAGAVAVPGTILLTPKDILYRSGLSEGVAYVCDPENAVKVDQVRRECPSLRTLLVAGGDPPSDGWRSYDDYANTLIRTNCIDNPKKIWWDVRPHPFFPTLEYRICDVPMRIDETICFAALFQAINKKLYDLYSQKM